jgi:bacteriophage exclusion system BrxA-like protein
MLAAVAPETGPLKMLQGMNVTSPPASEYNTRIQKGGALFNEMRLLARSWRGDMTAEQAVVTRTILGKRTLARSRDTLTRSFAPRFLHGDPPQAWRIVRYLEDRNTDPDILRPIYYWITARSDRLLYDYVAQELIQAACSGDGSVRIEETTGWIRRQLKRTNQNWSPMVTLKVARGLLACLRDFRILEGSRRKRLAPSHLPIESFCYVAFCLHKMGIGGESLVQHSDWRVFLLTTALIERLFLDAHQHNFLKFFSAGNLYRIDFPSTTHEGYADVLFRRKS